MKKQLFVIIISLIGIYSVNAQFTPGKTWLDTDGKTIEAHGGGILLVGAASPQKGTSDCC